MMLKYCFDTVEQLTRHLHVSDNSTLMFARDPGHSLLPGRGLLQLQVNQTGAAAIVRAEVVARSGGAIPGAWMQLDARLGRHLMARGTFKARHHYRICANHVVLVLSGRSVQAVQLLDVGTGGLRVRGELTLDDWYEVRLIGARRLECDLGVAEVVRVDASESGLRFVEPQSQAVRSLIGNLDTVWAGADRIEHPAACCAGGLPVEPVAPGFPAGAN